MAKPAGSSCNLDCRYCFYLSKQTLRGGPGAGRMTDRTLELFVRQYIEGNTGPEVVFSWQGGEPTLLGLDFFQRVVELQRRYARPGQRIENDLQTNGILLDAAWAGFLKEHRFLVGLSIDGPRELHDRYRVNKGGAPTFDKVMAAATVLRKAGVPFNTLTCVHRFNAERPLDVYRFLRQELDSTYIQLIPIVQARGFETDAPDVYDTAHMPIIGSARSKPDHPESIVTDWSVDPDRYGYFLSRVFDEWRRRDLGRVLVNHFETLVAQHLGLPAQICIYHQFCGKGVALEHDGGVYACDHYVYPQYLLGNLSESSLSEMVFSKRQVAFGYAKSETLPDDCRACEYLRDCWGECPGNRLLRTPSGEPGLNYLCSGLKKFFKHARPAIDEIAAAIRKQNG
ncbi:anaerobic sulfatase maturase [Rhodopseudomonas sp. BR0C11]|uniref:anaerobic sulfatase maturase n=1 Tax=Rhodopseudomonas sp. BR0C11 TaxID=2269370 RepID=UPI0013DE7E1A|nr:anaerobic sulfatase maturase [Rhodopseudomonas sp. BR0C11]NEV76988.1 anaerobic sulfatase maturase [Rhodopseudomonas sp. BR0C11]